MPFQIIRNDITKVKADAIVNTANPKPIYASGTDQAIYQAAGEKKLLKARQAIGDINPGYVAYTPAFRLKAKYIIHAVGPFWIDGEHDEEKTLQSCYERSLQLAEQLQCESIAFPLMATGNYGFPHDKAISIAMNTLQGYAMTHPMMIYLVVFGETATELIRMIYGKIKEYVDENYVESAKEREYHVRSLERERSLYRRSLIEKKPQTTRTERTSDGIIIEYSNDNLTFQEKLIEYLNEKNISNAALYKAAGITAAAFSKIMQDPYYHPQKNTAICFCVTLKLTINETMDLLARAGYTLSINDKRDMVIKGCIVHGLYDVQKIDNVLHEYRMDYIGKY